MPVKKVKESAKYGPTTPWNSPKMWNPLKTKVDISEKGPPRCACGGLFPLDTHPTTKDKICPACYKEATRLSEDK